MKAFNLIIIALLCLVFTSEISAQPPGKKKSTRVTVKPETETLPKPHFEAGLSLQKQEHHDQNLVVQTPRADNPFHDPVIFNFSYKFD